MGGGVGEKNHSKEPRRGRRETCLHKYPTKVVGRAAAQPRRRQGQLGRLRWVPGLLLSGRGTRPEVLGLGSSSAWPCGVTLGSAFSLFGSQNSFYPRAGPGELNTTTNTFRLLTIQCVRDAPTVPDLCPFSDGRPVSLGNWEQPLDPVSLRHWIQTDSNTLNTRSFT